MTTVGFWVQLKALLWRNVMLKKRNKWRTFQEFIFPIYFVGILAATRLSMKPEKMDPIGTFPVVSLDQAGFKPSSEAILFVSPNTADVENLTQAIVQLVGIKGYQLFSTAQASEDAYRDASNKSQTFLLGGIDFNDGNLLNYTIRMSADAVPETTNTLISNGQCRAPADGLQKSNCDANKYIWSGFLLLQSAIDTALLRVKTGRSDYPLQQYNVQMMPKGTFTTNFSTLQLLSALYLVIAFSPYVGVLAAFIVYEKEKKIKEGMRMMGMRDSAFWLSWAIVYAVMVAVTAILTALLLHFVVLPASNFFLLFLLLFQYGISIVTFAFMITPFFSKAEVAGAIASLASIVFSLLYILVSQLQDGIGPDGPISSIPVYAQALMSLLAPTAFALGINQAVFLDIDRGGLSWSSIGIGQFPVSWCMVMLAIDTVLYSVLAFYFDNVIPNEFGLRRPPWFCIMPSYWCNKKKVMPTEMSDLMMEENGDVQRSISQMDNPSIEAVPPEIKNKDVLRVFNIYKKFKDKNGKEVKAINGVSMDMYEGEITALLGHNGAGKTTLINMLTGMVAPSSGSAIIYNHDVTDSNDMTQIRSMTGICPQHNILFDDLSVTEHLRFFGMIKGMTGTPLESAIKESMKDVALTDQAEMLAKQLSGGQKRKLSVAIALIGDPKVIFLDEPTAGIDAYSRRHLWSLLKERKKNRLILLTTHFMDEADILADRKIIISKGKMKCCGTSLFLKNKFGIGYHLSMNMEEGGNLNTVTSLIKQRIQGAEIGKQHGKEITYTLPLDSVNKFVDVFGELEGDDGGKTKAKSLGIESYGISMTTLEEVFLKLEEEESVDDAELQNGGLDNPARELIAGEVDEANFMPSDLNNSRNSNSYSLATHSRVSNLTTQRFKTLVWIRCLEAFRNKVRFLFQLVFPVTFVILGTFLSGNLGNLKKQVSPALLLSPSIYAATGASSINPPMDYIKTGQGTPVDDFITHLGNLVTLKKIDNYTSLQQSPPHNLGLDILDINDTSVFSSSLTMIYNSSTVHSLPVILNTIGKVIAKMSSVGDIIATTQPWPDVNPSALAASGSAFTGGIFIGMAAALIPSGFGVQAVRDRVSKARSQLRITGVTLNLYWGALFCAHFIQYFIAVLICICAVLAIQTASLSSAGAIISLLLVFIFFMPLCLLFVYILSFAYNKFETAQAVMPMILSWIALIPYGLVFGLDVGGLHDTAGALHCVCCLLVPPYAVYGGVYFIQRVYLVQATIQSTEDPDISIADYFKWDTYIPATLIFPVIDAVWMYFMLRFLEVKKTGGDWRDIFLFGDGFKIKRSAPMMGAADDASVTEDDDVADVRRKALQDESAQNSVVLARELRKEFVKGDGGCCKKKEDKIKVAVHNNSFVVYPGEVFGLLGPNGAGKSTTLNMVIAEEGPTKGTVYVCGNDVRSSLSSAFQEMGYCPQHDPLWDRLTLKDHIEIYASLNGIPKCDIAKLVRYYMKSLKIEEHADKFTTDLSGGTKRKLSYIISDLGHPKAVLLDEPSTGMDPQSKRFFWDTVSSNFSGSDRGAILTTHYMEEAAALCDRVAIMVNGRMQCIGSIQHLKSKFGSGYILEIKQKLKFSPSEQSILSEKMKAYVETRFPGSVQSENFAERAVYKIPQASIKALAHAFGTMENAKQEHEIVEYSLSQSTLEQVFLDFAKTQEDDIVANK